MICVPFQPSLGPRSIHLAFTPVDKHPLPPKEPSPAHFAQPATVQNTHYHLTLHTQLGTLNSNSAHFLHCLTLCNLFNCANFPPSPPSWLADDTNQLILMHSPMESLQSSLQKIFLTASASSPAPPFALPCGWHWISKPTVGQSEHGCWPLLLLLWSSPRWDPDCWCFWNGGMIAMVEGHWFSSTRVWHTERDSTCQSVVVWWRMIGFLHPEPSPPPPVANPQSQCYLHPMVCYLHLWPHHRTCQCRHTAPTVIGLHWKSSEHRLPDFRPGKKSPDCLPFWSLPATVALPASPKQLFCRNISTVNLWNGAPPKNISLLSLTRMSDWLAF